MKFKTLDKLLKEMTPEIPLVFRDPESAYPYGYQIFLDRFGKYTLFSVDGCLVISFDKIEDFNDQVMFIFNKEQFVGTVNLSRVEPVIE